MLTPDEFFSRCGTPDSWRPLEKERQPMTAACECENVAHFEGGDCHAYGEELDIEDLTEVRTVYGRFTVCVGCREGHFPEEFLEAGRSS